MCSEKVKEQTERALPHIATGNTRKQGQAQLLGLKGKKSLDNFAVTEEAFSRKAGGSEEEKTCSN